MQTDKKKDQMTCPRFGALLDRSCSDRPWADESLPDQSLVVEADSASDLNIDGGSNAEHDVDPGTGISVGFAATAFIVT
jgi:hypothetical protein